MNFVEIFRVGDNVRIWGRPSNSMGVSMLSDSERMRICSAIKKGAKMMIGRDHTGRQKIKLIKGPFGLFVERIECSEADVVKIRKELTQKNSVAA